MGDTAFLSALMNFPKEGITDETVELLRPYFKAPDFNFESAKKARAALLEGWILFSALLRHALAAHAVSMSSPLIIECTGSLYCQCSAAWPVHGAVLCCLPEIYPGMTSFQCSML